MCRIGAHFGLDGRVAMSDEVREADKVLKNWAGASVVPPGVAIALKNLRAARKFLDGEVCDWLDLAETHWKRAVRARKEEIAEELPHIRAEATRKFRALLLGVEKDFRRLKVDVQKTVEANGNSAVRVHRRGPLAGTLAQPNALQRALLVSRSEKLRQQLKDAYEFVYHDTEGQPLRDLLSLPEDTFLPPALRREVDALAETLNSPDLPTEQDISRLVNSLTERNEAR